MRLDDRQVLRAPGPRTKYLERHVLSNELYEQNEKQSQRNESTILQVNYAENLIPSSSTYSIGNGNSQNLDYVYAVVNKPKKKV